MIQNLMARVNGAIGSEFFRHYYKDGEDLLQDGNLSCAYFVSTVLYLLKLIAEPHVTVRGTLADMEKSGWYKIQEVRIGCIIVWDSVAHNGSNHYHIGFYIGNDEAISNRSSLRVPAPHPLHYTGLDENNETKEAPIIGLYWHQSLD